MLQRTRKEQKVKWGVVPMWTLALTRATKAATVIPRRPSLFPQRRGQDIHSPFRAGADDRDSVRVGMPNPPFSSITHVISNIFCPSLTTVIELSSVNLALLCKLKHLGLGLAWSLDDFG